MHNCPHRAVPMFYGWNEKCGLRCVFHGWKFDVDGNCLEQPTETDARLKDQIKIKAYPTHESGDIVWAYMGPAEHKPEPPGYEWMLAPSTNRYMSRGGQDSKQ